MLGLIFTGASGVGKSTLAQWAARHFGLPLLPSVTSAVYRDHGTTFEEAFRDPDALTSIQADIHQRTTERLAAVVQPGVEGFADGFVTDRGPDVLVYTALMCHGAYPDGVPTGLDTILKRPDVLTVFVRPCRSVLEKARATDGGRRNLFLSDEWVYRVDGALAYHLESRNIPHITLDGEDHRGRRCSVLRAASGINWRGWPDPESKAVKQRSKGKGTGRKELVIDVKSLMRP